MPNENASDQGYDHYCRWLLNGIGLHNHRVPKQRPSGTHVGLQWADCASSALLVAVCSSSRVPSGGADQEFFLLLAIFTVIVVGGRSCK